MSASALGYEHVWRPAAGAERTLLLLHGTGGDEHDLIPLAEALDPTANVLSPRGNVLEHGMPRFFRRHGMGQLDLEDLAVRTRELAGFVRASSDRYGFDRATTVALGFSNGANIAASMLFEEPDALGAAILIRAMLPYRPARSPALEGKRVLVLAGERDPYSRREVSDELAAILRDGGAEVEVHYAKAGHELVPADVEAARTWLVRS